MYRTPKFHKNPTEKKVYNCRSQAFGETIFEIKLSNFKAQYRSGVKIS